MTKTKTALLLVAAALLGPSAQAQGIFDSTAVRGLSGGLGSGLAASLGQHGKVVQRSYEKMVNAQQQAMALSRSVDQYFKSGCSLESKNQWAAAENTFRYCLQLIARRDGPGSEKGVPTMQHLVKDTKAQNKLDDAIHFQTTVVAFMARQSDPGKLLAAQREMASLYMAKHDYASAQKWIQQSTDVLSKNPQVADSEKIAIQNLGNEIQSKLAPASQPVAEPSQAGTSPAVPTAATPTAVSVSPSAAAPALAQPQQGSAPTTAAPTTAPQNNPEPAK